MRLLQSVRRGSIRTGVALVLRGAAIAARADRTDLLERAGRALARWRRIDRALEPRAIAERWQRAFPSAKQVPIVEIDSLTATAYAEIRTPCPLRGTGELETCYRMMAYDRAFAQAAGGSFVVLRSQAEPGVSACRVALRPAQLDCADLVPAHLRAGLLDQASEPEPDARAGARSASAPSASASAKRKPA